MNWLLTPRLRPCIAWAAFASLVLNLAMLVPAIYMLEVFDRVFASRSVETLVMLTVFALMALGLSVCMDRVRSLLLARAGRLVDETLCPIAMSAALTEQAIGRFRIERSAVQDVARLRSFLASPAVNALFDAPWLPLYLLVMFALHPAMGAAAALSTLALLALGVGTERFIRADTERAVRSSRATQERSDALTRNAEVLVGMGMLRHALATWRLAHRDANDTHERLTDATATFAALSRGLRQLVQVAMLGLGAWLVVAGDASPGIMVAATVLIGRALQPVEHLIAGWKSLIEVRGAWKRLNEHQVDAPDRDVLQLPAPRGELSLERVSFIADPRRPPLIKGVTLALAPGQCLGLVGASASGKTTLVRLMLGLRAPHAGTVRLDGADLSAWPRDRLAGAVGYLPQDVELFAGSVAHNIAQLGEIDSPRVIEAAQRAGVHDMILRLPQGYETEVGDGGSLLSGGQRQRIALARAVYGDPKLVVLDEPNANLDADGEDALAAAIARLKQAGATVVLVSHRPSLVRSVDLLAVLRDGTLDAFGPRDQVLAKLFPPAVHAIRRSGPPPAGAAAAAVAQEAYA